MSAPTKAEKEYWDKLASVVGCIACHINGYFNTHVSIHHVDGRTKKGCHMKVLPLCERHHQHGTEDDPSIHPWGRRFTNLYGTEKELMDLCGRIIEARTGNVVSHE